MSRRGALAATGAEAAGGDDADEADEAAGAGAGAGATAAHSVLHTHSKTLSTLEAIHAREKYIMHTVAVRRHPVAPACVTSRHA
ncbi:conserved exported hypothetical protein [Paraburkholderia ribeironis]|uniref:Uncharacterized protein n=1 Tax=Paraburkholderia ribeironis TaxID=1247936 RepID=A0A1N7RM59_9BURK|nr:conserved exported hypothetical protein [Paraburkholderia ribeironis]